MNGKGLHCVVFCMTKYFQFRNIRTSSLCFKDPTKKWLARQKRDIFVKKAKFDHWRCRSAFKLIEIDDKYHIFKFGDVVVDCGASPGSWSQVTVERVNAAGQNPGPVGFVIGIDLLPVAPLAGAHFLGSTDFTDPSILEKIEMIKDSHPFECISAVISDMSPNASGFKSLDHQLSTELCLSALKFALMVLPPGGHFVSKLLQGHEQKKLESLLYRYFKKVSVFKPNASRQDSSELYLIAKDRLAK